MTCSGRGWAERRGTLQLLAAISWRLPLWVVVGAISTTIAGPATADEPSTAARDAVEMKVIFQENFEDGLEGWDLVAPKSWGVESHGKGKSLSILRRESEYQPKVRSPRHIALVKAVEVGDFQLQFQVKSTFDTGGHRDCCVFFGYQDPEHFYYVHLGAQPDPHSGQVFVVNDAPRTAITDNKRPVAWDDQWHQVKVERDLDSGVIAVYFDDMETPHWRVVDKTFGRGRIGIGSFDDMDAFDDIELRAAE